MATANPDLQILKTRLKAMWMAGDFGQVARVIETGAEEFVKRLPLKSGDRVLDVACGSGNVAIPAARSGATVTGVDIATNLLEQARGRAKAEKLSIKFEEGDAENLPYADKSFDDVITMFGAMFAPRPERVSAELVRVCRPGGFIAMANWTPEGFIGQMFRVTGNHVPPPANIPSPIKWGEKETVRKRLQDGIADLKLTRRICEFKFPFPPADVVEFYRKFYGPTQRAFDSLDVEGQVSLRSDLENLWKEHNKATDNATHVDAEYLEVVAKRR